MNGQTIEMTLRDLRDVPVGISENDYSELSDEHKKYWDESGGPGLTRVNMLRIRLRDPEANRLRVLEGLYEDVDDTQIISRRNSLESLMLRAAYEIAIYWDKYAKS